MTGLPSPQDLTNLLARRSAIYAQLAAMTTTSPGGGPNTTGEGVSVDQVGYRKSLLDELAALNEQISIVSGPYQFQTRGRI
ncbi:MAG TPA: hypothetical protein VGP63_13520 [Planctomycetaceae bacterium]|jgi:hypothetical protein|nr:hypothetical protein [Planctomycetaceae bacterium]